MRAERDSTCSVKSLSSFTCLHKQRIQRETLGFDVRILTSGGLDIAAHSFILASNSSVFENILQRSQNNANSEKIVPILGVPCEAVVVFIRFLYNSRCLDEEEVEKHGIHLLVLSHVFSVPSLKQLCTKGLALLLTAENVVDILQLARLCDAPNLYVKCIKLLAKDFNAVQSTEGWKFLQAHDPWLELELLQFLDEAELRKKKRIKNRETESVYMQLSEAMDCLQHICIEGCTTIVPFNRDPLTHCKHPCERFEICQSLQLLIHHFATCQQRNGCRHCRRMWQLFRLHSWICDQSEPCNVPLCRQFKLRMQLENKECDGKWKLLVRKVVSARVFTRLSKRDRKGREITRGELV